MSRLELEAPALTKAVGDADEATKRRVAKAVSEFAWNLRPIADPRAQRALESLVREQFGDSMARSDLERLGSELDERQRLLWEALDAGAEGVSDEDFDSAFECARTANALWFALDDDPLAAALEASYEVHAGFEDFETVEALLRAVLRGEQDAVPHALRTFTERLEAPPAGEAREQFVGPDGTVPGLDAWAPDMVDSLREVDPDGLRRIAQAACELALERAPIEDHRIEAARAQIEAGPFGDSPTRAALQELVHELLAEEIELEGEWDPRPLEERERDPLVPSYRVEKGILVPDGTSEEIALEYARQAAEQPGRRRTVTAHALWQALDEDALNAAVGALDAISSVFLNVDVLRTLVDEQVPR